MLNIEIAKVELTGGHIGIMRIIDCHFGINWRPYWNFANYNYNQNRIKRRPYWNYAFYSGCHIEIIFIDMEKPELCGSY